MTVLFLDVCPQSMTQLRDMENNHHEKVNEIAVTLLERMAKNQLEEDLHDDLKLVSHQMYKHEEGSISKLNIFNSLSFPSHNLFLTYTSTRTHVSSPPSPLYPYPSNY